MASLRTGLITICFALQLLLVPQISGLRMRTSSGKRAANSNNLTVTTILAAPFLFKKEPSNGLVGNDRYEGYVADLTKQLCDALGVHCTLKLVEDGRYGQRNTDDDTWDGMMGEVTRGVADLVAAPLTVTSQRARAVDFTFPFMTFGFTILVKKPTPTRGGTRWFMMLEPFTVEVWASLGGCYIVVSLVLFVLSRCLKRGREARSEETLRRERARELGPQLTDSFWWTARSFLYQGWNSERWPTSPAVRVLSCFWFIFSLLTVLLYLVSLNQFLPSSLSPRLLTPIENADDLAQQTEIKYGVVEGGSTQTFFSESQKAVYQRMWLRMYGGSPSVFVSSTKEGEERVRTSHGRYAFITESSIASYLVQRKPCDLLQVGNLLNQLGYGLATPKGSKLHQRLNTALLQLKEDGSLSKLEKKWWYDKGECSTRAYGPSRAGQHAAQQDVFRSLGAGEFVGPFLLLAVGLLLTILVAVVEAVLDKACGKSEPLSNDGNNEDQQLKTTDPATF